MDRLWGSRKTVLIGGILIMIGHIVLATPFGKASRFISFDYSNNVWNGNVETQCV